ncbi:cation-translocating P-type ATPase [Egicoccus sp. AB-alg2]|uniref:cation-translocating P-type ATPase n=1 Tax=Egicoccus sp. AB-alg2 TaxID=3242693 RepID=UPI00359CF9A8
MGEHGRVEVPAAPRPQTGLTAAEAAARHRRDGPNRLPAPLPVPAWRQLLRQMVSFFAVLLWVAAGLAVVAGTPQLGIAIAVVVVVNAGFAFVQEHRAERSAARLRELLPRRTTVVRDGVRVEVDAEELVVDDRVVLATGDRVSADLLLRTSHGLGIDTSTLTGESVPVSPEAGAELYAGTFVVEGEGEADVAAIGAATRLAGIAQLAQAAPRRRSPLAAQLRQVVRTISLVAIGVGTSFFALMLLLGTPASEGFVFAVGVTVALVPEGLLPTVTLSLAIAAQRMAERQALVRHLEAVETLGSTTFICTDKTGTLTRNEMSVVRVWTPAGGVRVEGTGYEPTARVLSDAPSAWDALRRLALAAVRCSTGRVVFVDGRWAAQGDPMEAALDVLARRVDVKVADDTAQHPEVVRRPFDPRRRRMSVVTRDEVYVKGAPDSVLPRCREVNGAPGELETMARRGLRVLAVAARPAVPADVDCDADALERDLELLGLVGIEDPPRPHVHEALRACREAGVRVAMITGDHPATARAIAEEVGLTVADAPVLTGDELPADEGALGRLLDRDGVVVSRVSPEDKLRIARALQTRGHVVAMTGDGVNDGPALQAADIGIAMGRSGTDVARDAADLVLLDDDFATIVVAIAFGRGTFGNLRRFLTYHLTDNVAELTPFVLWALSGGRFPLALGVLQILALDIGTDTFSAVALGAERPSDTVLRRPPTAGRLLDRRTAWRAFGVLGPTEAFLAIAAFVVSFLAAGWRPGAAFPASALAAASGAAFLAVVVGQGANAFACRSTRRPGWVAWRTNRLLLVAVPFALVLGLLSLLVRPVADVLGQASPPPAGWLVAAAAGPAVLLVDAVEKRWRRRAARQTAPSLPS